MDEYKSVKKYLSKNKIKHTNKRFFISKMLNHILLSSLLLIITLCIIKVNPKFKTWINKNIYNTNISFTKFNQVYEKYIGNIFNINNTSNTTSVFDEKLVYSSISDYKEGVKLTVSNNYLVPVIESGIIVYIGDKDNYGKTIIIQQVNGIDIWYVGVDNSNLKLYDYVEKGSLLGESISNEIYLYYQKGGEFLDYKEYLE